MINDKIMVVGCGDYNDGKVKEVAQKVKTCDIGSIATAGFAMARRLKKALGPHVEDCVLVPVPGRGGTAIYTDLMARVIGGELDIPVTDAVRGNERCSFCDLKKKKGVEIGSNYNSFFGFKVASAIPYHKKIVFVDNVMDTGITLDTIERLFPENECIGLVYAQVGGI